VVVGNPPYSALQTSENDGNKNLSYPTLDERIRTTYAARSSAVLKNSLYDSYVRAIRWASDRIHGRGVVGFVTNGSFIDGNALDGLRACLAEEFTNLYVFNLRGNQRTSGELSRMEGGKIFGSGSRTPVAISILVRNPDKNTPGELFYHDIGDYLPREEKLSIIRRFSSLNGLHRERKWVRIQPNANHDWINQRDPAFESFIPLGDKRDDAGMLFFGSYSHGVKTNRDVWCYNFSEVEAASNMSRMVDFYNEEVSRFERFDPGRSRSERSAEIDGFVDADPKRISWSRSLKQDLGQGKRHTVIATNVRCAIYRPYCRQQLYFDRSFNDVVGLTPALFPTSSHPNVAISVMGAGASKDFSALLVNVLPDYELISKGQCFPLYLYEKDQPDEPGELLAREQEGELIDGYRRRSAITPGILAEFRAAYEERITAEDIFYYVYGVLHSPEYRTRFASDLKKMLPRLPLTRETADFWRFSQAGRDLAYWHLNYETVKPWPVKEHSSELLSDPTKDYLVQKMTYGRPTAAQKAAGEKLDKTVLHYNSRITLTDIPLEAYNYVVNGKPALDWIVERYQVTVDKDSGIRNDPNDWAREHNQPRYILDLFKRVIRVSMETNCIVGSLPALNERTR